MKILFILFLVIHYSQGIDLLAFFKNDLRTYLDSVSKDCAVAPTQGCPAELTYWLYTRKNRNGEQLHINELQNSALIDGRQLKLLIHGYWNNHNSLMVKDLKDAYLDTDDINVVAVDWGHFCSPGCYVQAVASINPVAGCVTEFIRQMTAVRNFGYIHILGHSLGAHIGARVSTHFDPPLDRLTRFDPALPLFLDSTTNKGSARFRDVYHSNTGVLGQTDSQGDVDVYLNSDMFQPGCGCDLACSHMRSVQYFAESIRHGMKGFYCSAWDKFLSGECKAPTKETLKEVGDRVDQSLTQSSIKVFGKPNSPFLYSEEDYLAAATYENFKHVGKGECLEEIIDKVKAFLTGNN